MIDSLKSFKQSLAKSEEFHIDNNVFQLHYKYTTCMLMVFSFLLTSKQYFGDPISCDVGPNDANREHINTYCWIYGTYTFKKEVTEEFVPWMSKKNGWQHPSWIRDLEVRPDKEIVWQKYYQWVCIIFFLQIACFYAPRALWKTWEGGRLRLLLKDLSGPLVPSIWNEGRKTCLIAHMLNGGRSHNWYAVRYVICEFLNLANVIGQIFFLNWFLDGQFLAYGIQIATYNYLNPMWQVFPKVAKCLYFNYGPSGSIQSKDALCTLPLNILNEKLFILLWYWLFLLTVMSFVSLAYTLCLLTMPKLRMYLISAQTLREIGLEKAHLIVNELTYGDCFLLYLLSKNVNPILYSDILLGMHEQKLKDKKIGFYLEQV